MNLYKYLFLVGIFCFFSCEDYLDKEPYDILTDETVWTNATLVEGVIANLYDRMPTNAFNEFSMQTSDEAMWSGGGDGLNRTNSIPEDWYQYYDYDFIRDINLFIEKCRNSNLENRDNYIAEARFIRAFVYFELVKRMGGVPLITETYTYEGSEVIDELQKERSKESDIYDFIYTELESIKNTLTFEKNPNRATKWAALSLQARAMLYAGSLAKYNSSMSHPVILQNGIVGISGNKANDYYTKALNAAKEIITIGGFDLEEDYFSVFNNKRKQEVILAVDFKLPNRIHTFTYHNSTPSAKEDNEEGSHITPFLEMVESYQYLDGASGILQIENEDGSSIYFDTPQEVFANKDLRFGGTILYANQFFRNSIVSLQKGQMVYNESTGAYDFESGDLGEFDDNSRLKTGWDGPSENLQFVTNTGFYMKKFVSTAAGAGQRSTHAENWWPIFRYSEILLIASEASLELGNNSDALHYINKVRERAGFGINSLDTITLVDIINERRVELAFEGHRFFDLKRWRIAENVLNGKDYHSLYGYLVVHPGSELDGKYVYKKVVAPRLFNSKKKFEWSNYYSSFPQEALDKNPKLIKNPGH